MADQSALKHAFAHYARCIAGQYDIGTVLYQLTDQVLDIFGVAGSGVSLGDERGRLQFVTASDERVSVAEREQIESQEGPCHDAYRSGDQVTAADLDADERWPTYRPTVLAQGLRAVAGIAMRFEDQRIGALNLYHSRPREWPADDLQDAQLLADMATGYIVNARTLLRSEQLAEQLQHALDSRIVIEQAKGIMAERSGVTPTEAFEVLRRYARSSSAKLHDTARAVVEGRLRI